MVLCFMTCNNRKKIGRQKAHLLVHTANVWSQEIGIQSRSRISVQEAQFIDLPLFPAKVYTGRKWIAGGKEEN